jgi:hypothetical protein
MNCCDKPNCNQGRCDCPPIFIVPDKAFLYLEGLLFVLVIVLSLITWRVW